MATRIYLPYGGAFDASGDSSLTGMTWNSGWLAVAPGGSTAHQYAWANITNIGLMPPAATSQPAQVFSSHNFSSGSYASSNFRYGARYYLGPLKAGTVFSATTITGVVGCRTGTFTNTQLLAMSAQIRSYANVLRHTIEPAGTDWRDGTNWSTSFTTRWDQAATASSYTTQADDWLLIEIGSYNNFLDSEFRYFELGCDSATADATSTDTTAARNGWFELGDDGTLAIASAGVPNQLMLTGCGI